MKITSYECVQGIMDDFKPLVHGRGLQSNKISGGEEKLLKEFQL